MKRLVHMCVALCAFFMVSSCESPMDSNTWGTTEYYKDFLFKKCPPDTLSRTLVVSFNDESEKLPDDNRTLVMSLYKVTDSGEYHKVDPAEAQVCVNGKASADNTISLAPTGTPDQVQRIKVGIVMSKQYLETVDDDCTVSYLLKVEKNPGYDRLNDLDICSTDSRKATPVLDKSKDSWTPMTVYIDKVSNSLKVGLIWGVCLLTVFFLIWLIISRFVIWKATSFSSVYIDYNDGAGERPIRMHGAYELVFTGNPHAKDSVMAKIFKGSRKYEYNEFWSHDIVMKDSSRRRMIRVAGLREYSVAGETERGCEFQIYDENGKKVNIQTT